MADLKSEIVTQFTALLKGHRISPRERQLVRECAADAAAVHIQALAGAITKDKAARENRQIEAQVRTIESIAGGRAAALFWRAVNLAAGIIFKAVVP